MKLLHLTLYAVLGWSLNALIMGVGLPILGCELTLWLHLLTVPVTYIILTMFYQRRRAFSVPARIAGFFTGIAFLLNFILLSLVVEQYFELTRSVKGFWAPLILVFTATYVTMMRKKLRDEIGFKR